MGLIMTINLGLYKLFINIKSENLVLKCALLKGEATILKLYFFIFLLLFLLNCVVAPLVIRITTITIKATVYLIIVAYVLTLIMLKL